jgi:membrane protein insertase Oxa1/YidC/SpoIIIJ
MKHMHEQNLSAQLKDIKPLLDIPDNSFYLYWGLIILGALLLLVLIFFAAKKYMQNRKINLAKGYVEKLKAIDWKDPKKAAYDATHYARLLATDERRKELFSQLEPLLEKFKYKKEVEDVDQDTINRFNLYVQVADESI